MTLEEIAVLEDDWDGLGADAISSTVIEEAKSLLKTFRGLGFPEPVRIIPKTGGGGVHLEWQTPTCYLDVEIDGSGRPEIMWTSR